MIRRVPGPKQQKNYKSRTKSDRMVLVKNYELAEGVGSLGTITNNAFDFPRCNLVSPCFVALLFRFDMSRFDFRIDFLSSLINLYGKLNVNSSRN